MLHSVRATVQNIPRSSPWRSRSLAPPKDKTFKGNKTQQKLGFPTTVLFIWPSTSRNYAPKRRRVRNVCRKVFETTKHYSLWHLCGHCRIGNPRFRPENAGFLRQSIACTSATRCPSCFTSPKILNKRREATRRSRLGTRTQKGRYSIRQRKLSYPSFRR